jgi:hypothetical protein
MKPEARTDKPLANFKLFIHTEKTFIKHYFSLQFNEYDPIKNNAFFIQHCHLAPVELFRFNQK